MGLLNILFGNQKKHVDLVSLNRDLEILNDCARLIENTTNPEVFFSRYELYMSKLSILSNAEKLRQVKVTGESFCQKYGEINTEDKKVESINDFIDRMWADTCRKAEGLKLTRESKIDMPDSLILYRLMKKRCRFDVCSTMSL